MAPARFDRELRRLVSEIATLPPDDLEAILAEFDPGSRRRLSDLVAEYLDAPAAHGSPRPDLSAWLQRRLDAALSSSAADGFALTAAAHEALRASAVQLPPPPPSARSGGPGIWWCRVIGRRT